MKWRPKMVWDGLEALSIHCKFCHKQIFWFGGICLWYHLHIFVWSVFVSFLSVFVSSLSVSIISICLCIICIYLFMYFFVCIFYFLTLYLFSKMKLSLCLYFLYFSLFQRHTTFHTQRKKLISLGSRSRKRRKIK